MDLKDELLMDISRCSVWDYKTLKRCFDILNSIDLVRIAVNMCYWMGLDLDYATNLIKSTLDFKIDSLIEQ